MLASRYGARAVHQSVVVGKTGWEDAAGRLPVEIQPLGPELRCCWQEAPGRRQSTKSQQQKSLSRKLSCCWQDGGGVVFGPGGAAAGGSARPPRDDPAAVASSSRGAGPAIFAGYRGTPVGTRDQQPVCAGDRHCAAAAGKQAQSRPIVRDGTSRVGMLADNSGSAVLPCQCCRTNLLVFQTR